MTTILLIRHALCDPVGRAIAGRAAGVHLNHEGRREAEALAGALGHLPVRAIYSSPLERALQTAEPLARRTRATVTPVPELNEIDFGDWTGSTLEELAKLPLWLEWNQARDSTRIPNGEAMPEVVGRAMRVVTELAERHQGQIVAAVTHGDVIRGVLAHILGMPLVFLHRLEVRPASVNAVRLEQDGARLLSINWKAGDGPVQPA